MGSRKHTKNVFIWRKVFSNSFISIYVNLNGFRANRPYRAVHSAQGPGNNTLCAREILTGHQGGRAQHDFSLACLEAA